jgi:hypothetical protein
MKSKSLFLGGIMLCFVAFIVWTEQDEDDIRWYLAKKIAMWLTDFPYRETLFSYRTALGIAAVLTSPFLYIGLVLIVLSFIFPRKCDLERSIKVDVKSPDGVESVCSFDELRRSLLQGKITTDWVARKRGEAKFRPVTDVLYAPNDTKGFRFFDA